MSLHCKDYFIVPKATKICRW